MMRTPPHPGAGIGDEIDALGISLADAAKGLGVTRRQLKRIINGESSITPEMAFRLETAIGSKADFWLRLQMNFDLAQVRERAASIKVHRLSPKAA